MIANIMASSVSLISATTTEKQKSKKNHSSSEQQLQHFGGAAQYKHSDSEPAGADKTMEMNMNLSQEDTSADGQGRESVHVPACSHSPEQLSSPRMPLSPMGAPPH